MLKKKKVLKRDRCECNRYKKFKLVSYIKENLDSNIENLSTACNDNNLNYREYIEISLDKYENLYF